MTVTHQYSKLKNEKLQYRTQLNNQYTIYETRMYPFWILFTLRTMELVVTTGESILLIPDMDIRMDPYE